MFVRCGVFFFTVDRGCLLGVGVIFEITNVCKVWSIFFFFFEITNV